MPPATASRHRSKGLPFGLTVTMDGRQGAELVAVLRLPKMIPVHGGMADRIIEVQRGAPVTV
jgi:hypothetical protein